MYASTLRPVFYGVASADIVYGSNLLKVKATELLPNIRGEVNTEVNIITSTVKTRKGEIKKNIITSDFINCYWFNRNSNRGTAPDVMKGERVLVWQDADSENYYWESTNIDTHLRTTEHVIFFFSNTNPKDRTDKILSFKNCYIIEVDTKGKKIAIRTNKNAGEPFAYDIVLDTKKGNWKLSDDVGNYSLLDSANTVIELMNKDKTQYRMDKKDIIEKCLGNRSVTVGGTNTVTVTGSNTVSAASNTETYKGANSITAPNTTFNGAVAVTVSLGVPLLSASSGVTAGTIESDSLTVDGTLTAGIGNFSGRVSASNI